MAPYTTVFLPLGRRLERPAEVKGALVRQTRTLDGEDRSGIVGNEGRPQVDLHKLCRKISAVTMTTNARASRTVLQNVDTCLLGIDFVALRPPWLAEDGEQ